MDRGPTGSQTGRDALCTPRRVGAKMGGVRLARETMTAASSLSWSMRDTGSCSAVTSSVRQSGGWRRSYRWSMSCWRPIMAVEARPLFRWWSPQTRLGWSFPAAATIAMAIPTPRLWRDGVAVGCCEPTGMAPCESACTHRACGSRSGAREEAMRRRARGGGSPGHAFPNPSVNGRFFAATLSRTRKGRLPWGHEHEEQGPRCEQESVPNRSQRFGSIGCGG